MIDLGHVTIAGTQYRLRQTSERMGQVLVLDADGETLGRGASRVQAVREARQRIASLPADVITAADLNALTVEPADDYRQIHQTGPADRVSVARLRAGDVVSFEASTKVAATFYRVVAIKAVAGTRPRQPRRYEIEISDGRGVSSFGASTKVWVLR